LWEKFTLANSSQVSARAEQHDGHACGTALARAEQTFDRATREDDFHELPEPEKAVLSRETAGQQPTTST
jgi:hypothetical protein